MAEDVAKLLVQISATTALLQQNLIKAELEVARTQGNINRDLDKIDRKFDTLGKAGGRLKSVFSGFTSGAFAGLLASVSSGAIIAATRNALDFAGSLGEVADGLGVSTKFLQEFRFAAQQNGSTLEQADTALGKFTLTIGKAREGSKAQAEAFRELGISLADAEGKARATDQVFLDVADAIARIDDPTRQSAIGAELFGKGFRTLLPLLKQGAKGFELTAAEARKLGVVLTDKQIQDADKTADRISALTDALSVRFAGVVSENATAIGDLADGLANLVGSAIRATSALSKFFAVSDATRRTQFKLGKADEIIEGNRSLTPEQKQRAKQIARNRINSGANADAREVGRLGDGALGGLIKIRDTNQKPKVPVSFFTAQDSAASDFGQLVESLQFGIPLAETFGAKLDDIRSTEADIGGEARALIDAYRESNRLGLLRAQGRNDEADEAEALARVAEEVGRIDGLSVTQREKLLALAQSITIEGIRQRKLAEDRLDLENQLLDAQEADARAAEDGAYNAATRQIEEYKRQGEAANAYLADTFETLFTDGFDGVWRSFKAQGLRALAELLANIISPADGGLGGLGGGLGGLLGGVFKTVFNPNGIPGRATGGPVEAGKPYIVGEKRAELFIPRVPGYIQPSLNGGGGGGGVSLTINAPGATAETVMMIRRELANAAPQIVSAARNATVRDMSRQRLP